MRKYKLHLNCPLLIICTFQNLSLFERTEFINLLLQFHDIFSPSDGPTGHTSVVTHTIPTTGPPIHQPLRQVPESLKDTVKVEVHHILERDIIRPSSSPWSSL